MALRKRRAEPPVPMHMLQQRVQSLYQKGAVTAQTDDLLNQAFEELAYALEELQAADLALHRQREEWLNQQTAYQLESQRYKDLFERAPAGYLVTSVDGAIRQANATALALLQTTDRAIVGRSLSIFVSEGQRRGFRQQIARVLQASTAQEWVSSMRSWEGNSLEIRLTASVLPGPNGRPLALYWLLHVVTEPEFAIGSETDNTRFGNDEP